jgi:hypothetical protein
VEQISGKGRRMSTATRAPRFRASSTMRQPSSQASSSVKRSRMRSFLPVLSVSSVSLGRHHGISP